MTTVVATVGTIPGAGATSVVAALGAALGEQRRQVALVDASAEGSRIGDVLDLEDGGAIADAVRRNASLAEVQATGPHGVAAFPAGPDTDWGAIPPDDVATVYEQLRERFEVVLVDCGSDLPPASVAWLGHADEVLVVTDPDVTAPVGELATLAGAFDVTVRGVVGNRVPPLDTKDALRALATLDQRVVGVLPEDATVDTAADAGESVLLHEPDSPIASTIWRFALRLREDDHDEVVVPQGTVPTRHPGDDATSATDPERRRAREGRTNQARTATASGGSPGGVDGDGGSASADGGGERTDADSSGAGGSARRDRERRSSTTLGPSGSGSTGGATPVADGAPASTPEGDRDAASIFGGDGREGPGNDAGEDRSTAPAADDGDDDDWTAGEAAASRTTSEEPSPANPRGVDRNSEVLSDEEIEEVFRETMQRVKRQREAEERDGS